MRVWRQKQEPEGMCRPAPWQSHATRRAIDPWLLIAVLLLAAQQLPAIQRAQGWCEDGSQTAQVVGYPSSSASPSTSPSTFPFIAPARRYPSCTVTVYRKGTLHLAPIANDPNGTPLANPFTADSVGSWSFYASGRFDVKLSGPGISPAGTTRSIQLLDTRSVVDFGATGSGTTDDTIAIQAAITAAASLGATVNFPPGSYLINSITLANGVPLYCESTGISSNTGVTFLAATDSEIMFHGSALSRSGIEGCSIDSNGKSGVTAIQIDTFSGLQNHFRDLLISNVATGFNITQNFLGVVENVWIFNPTSIGILCGANCNGWTFNSIDVLNANPAAVTGFQFNNNGSNSISASYFEGYLQNFIYNSSAISLTGDTFENSGTPPSAPYYIQIGTNLGATTSGISITGSAFNAGADYGLYIASVQALTVTGDSFSTGKSAFFIDNTGSATANTATNIGNNFYTIGNAPSSTPTAETSFAAPWSNTAANMFNQEVLNPLLFDVPHGEPPDASFALNGQGALYADPPSDVTTNKGFLWWKYRDNSGAIHHWPIGADRLYYDPDPGFQSPAFSIFYQREGVDGASLNGYGGVQLNQWWSDPHGASHCLGQFGGLNGSTYFSSIGFGKNNCLPPPSATVSIMDNSDSGSTTAEVQAGAKQATSPLVQYKQHDGTAIATVNADGSTTVGTVPFSALTGDNGTRVYCSDCTIAVRPPWTCAGGGTGATAMKSAGVWKCPF